jgi:predicted O-linked N-acetylglucosamine transferase (SPINDLY family)
VSDEIKKRLQKWYDETEEQRNKEKQREEEVVPIMTKRMRRKQQRTAPPPVNPADFGDLPPHILRALTPLLPQADPFIPNGAGEPLRHFRHFQDRLNSPSSPLSVSSSRQQKQHPHDIRRNHKQGQKKKRRPLHIGFVSSDLGVHPISSLLRGFLESLSRMNSRTNSRTKRRNRRSPFGRDDHNDDDDDEGLVGGGGGLEVEVTCWVLTDDDSWWRKNISDTLNAVVEDDYKDEDDDASKLKKSLPMKQKKKKKKQKTKQKPLFHRFVSLHGLPYAQAAAKIKASGVDVLVDLNGHTKGSGLPLLRFRPAPVQVMSRPL